MAIIHDIAVIGIRDVFTDLEGGSLLLEPGCISSDVIRTRRTDAVSFSSTSNTSRDANSMFSFSQVSSASGGAE